MNEKARQLAKQEKGFSLPELMVVIVIVGILALLAIPKFLSVVSRAKKTEAKTMLRHVKTLQEAYYFERDRYGKTLREIGFEQSRLVTDGGNARYRVRIEEAGGAGFVATATAVVDFDKDGMYNIWQINEQGNLAEQKPD